MAVSDHEATAILSYPPTNGLDWRLENVKLPKLGNNELLVRMVATGLCHTDIVYGAVPERAGPIPRVLGHEGAGYVEAVGSRVTVAKTSDAVVLSFRSCNTCRNCSGAHPAYCLEFTTLQFSGQPALTHAKTGEPVAGGFFGQSSFASLAIVNEASVVNVSTLVDSAADLRLYAPLGCGMQTGAGTITNIANVKAGDVVVVLGLGGVGLTAIMAALTRKCAMIVGVDRYEDRLMLAKSVGATHVINTGDPNLNIKQCLMDLTSGLGASTIVDTTGVPALIASVLDCVAHAGQMVLVGYPPPGSRIDLDLLGFFRKGTSLRVSIEGDVVPSQYIPQLIEQHRAERLPIEKIVSYYEAEDHAKAVADMKAGLVVKPVLLW